MQRSSLIRFWQTFTNLKIYRLFLGLMLITFFRGNDINISMITAILVFTWRGHSIALTRIMKEIDIIHHELGCCRTFFSSDYVKISVG